MVGRGHPYPLLHQGLITFFGVAPATKPWSYVTMVWSSREGLNMTWYHKQHTCRTQDDCHIPRSRRNDAAKGKAAWSIRFAPVAGYWCGGLVWQLQISEVRRPTWLRKCCGMRATTSLQTFGPLVQLPSLPTFLSHGADLWHSTHSLSSATAGSVAYLLVFGSFPYSPGEVQTKAWKNCLFAPHSGCFKESCCIEEVFYLIAGV